jgi:hypothetical protein
MDNDPVLTNPGFYRVIMENDRVRVLEYVDAPGDKTVPHSHPDSVMITLSPFTRRLSSGDREVDVSIPSGVARWVPAQEHAGENTGDTATHTIFVELKEPPLTPPGPNEEQPLGPGTALPAGEDEVWGFA